MINKKYYKVTTDKGVVVRSTNHYFSWAVVVDGGEEVTFCRKFNRADSVQCSKMKFSRNVDIYRPTEITKDEYDGFRVSRKVSA